MKKLAITLGALFFSLQVWAQQKDLPTAYFQFGGYAKADVLVTTYFNGLPVEQSPIKDIHIPSAIPIGPRQTTHDTYFHAKESRIHFDAGGKIKGKSIRAYVELDFLLSKNGDERVSNSYNPRLREFYIEYDKLIAGQTWSNFMVLILPEDLDFIGAAEGMVFNRQPQVRLTLGSWRFSVENPQAFITPNDGGDFIAATGGIPDITARKDFNESWGTLSIATIIRSIRIRDAQNTLHFSPGLGLTIGSKINIGARDDLRVMATIGNGLGRYVGIAFVNAGVLEANSDIDLIGSLNGYVSYLHYWSENWKSSVNISGFRAQNNTALGGLDQNHSAWSVSGNLLYQVSPELLFGGEAMYGYRDQESEVSGSFLRIQFSAKYSFRYKSNIGN
jgi:hypothetical protein